MSQLLTQIQDLQNRVNSLSDAKEFYDPESGSISRATHVPDQPSTIPSPRTMPRHDSGLPRDTRNGKGIAGNVFEQSLQQFKEFVIFTQDLRLNTSETARTEMKMESLNTPTKSPHH